MEVEKNVAEVSYTLSISQLSSYKELSQAFTADFPLSVDGFRTQWRLSVTPFLKDRCDSETPVNRNVGISLHCVKCNVNHPDIDIYCSVVGRDQHEKKLSVVCGSGLRWHGILVPRLALGIFKLLVDDQLTAKLRFVIKGSDMSRAVPSIENLSRNLRELHKTGMYSDMEVVTSEGTRCPAHRAILYARSNLLRKAEVTKRCGTDSTATGPMLELGTTKAEFNLSGSETPINSTFGSMSSGYRSISSLSPDSSQKSVPTPTSSPSKGHKSPMKKAHVNTPTSRVHFAPQTMASPGKCPSTPTECAFSSSRTPPGKRRLTPIRTSASKRFPAPNRMSPGKRMATPNASPLKRPSVSLAEATPRRRLYQPHEPGIKDEPQLTAPLVDSPSLLHGSCSTSLERSPLRERIHNRVGGPGEELAVKVNISTTVTLHLLEWIYTGECVGLGSLARPLLVAGLRHGVADLTRACEQHLAADLTPTNASDALLLAHKYGAPVLREAAFNFAVQQAAEVTSQPSWASVAARAPTLVLEFSRRLALHAHTKE